MAARSNISPAARVPALLPNPDRAIRPLPLVFPSPVRPQPYFGLCDNILLQPARVQFGHLVVSSLFWMLHQQFRMQAIISSFQPPYRNIYNGHIEFFRYHLSSLEYGRILVQKSHPVGVVGKRRLVGDKSGSSYLPPVRQHVLKSILHSYQPGTEARPHAIHKAIEILIGKRVINNIQLVAAEHAEGVTRPLPITPVAQNKDDALLLIRKLVEQLQAFRLKGAAFQHSLTADSQRLKSLQEKVAEIMVEFFADYLYLRLRFFREGIAEILQHYIFPVTDNAVEQYIYKVGKQVQYREWQQRKKVDKRNRQVVTNSSQWRTF